MARTWHVGDRALHKSNQLDSRPVAAVERVDGVTYLRLQIGTIVTDPIPASNYDNLGAGQ